VSNNNNIKMEFSQLIEAMCYVYSDSFSYTLFNEYRIFRDQEMIILTDTDNCVVLCFKSGNITFYEIDDFIEDDDIDLYTLKEDGLYYGDKKLKVQEDEDIDDYFIFERDDLICYFDDKMKLSSFDKLVDLIEMNDLYIGHCRKEEENFEPYKCSADFNNYLDIFLTYTEDTEENTDLLKYLSKKLNIKVVVNEEPKRCCKFLKDNIFDLHKQLNKNIECVICLETIDDKNKLEVSQCGHYYCDECFMSMCKMEKKQCAICRHQL